MRQKAQTALEVASGAALGGGIYLIAGLGAALIAAGILGIVFAWAESRGGM